MLRFHIMTKQLLGVLIAAVHAAACFQAEASEPEPANPKANAKVKAVLSYFYELAARTNQPDKRLVSGQFTDFGPGAKLTNCQEPSDKTGHWPAMIGVDYADFGKGGLD